MGADFNLHPSGNTDRAGTFDLRCDAPGCSAALAGVPEEVDEGWRLYVVDVTLPNTHGVDEEGRTLAQVVLCPDCAARARALGLIGVETKLGGLYLLRET